MRPASVSATLRRRRSNSARPQLPLQLGHVLRERRLAQVQDRGRATEALRPGHRQEDLELPEAELHKPDLIEGDKNTRLDLIQAVDYPRSRPSLHEGGPPMIFREFLAPKTGCASYLFG